MKYDPKFEDIPRMIDWWRIHETTNGHLWVPLFISDDGYFMHDPTPDVENNILPVMHRKLLRKFNKELCG